MGFKLANISGRAALIDKDNFFDLETISEGLFDHETSNALSNLKDLHKLSAELSDKEATGSLENADFKSPVSSPKNCYAVGLNYRNHAEEAGMEIPDVPMIFTKHTTCLSLIHI